MDLWCWKSPSPTSSSPLSNFLHRHVLLAENSSLSLEQLRVSTDAVEAEAHIYTTMILCNQTPSSLLLWICGAESLPPLCQPPLPRVFSTTDTNFVAPFAQSVHWEMSDKDCKLPDSHTMTSWFMPNFAVPKVWCQTKPTPRQILSWTKVCFYAEKGPLLSLSAKLIFL